MDLRRHYCRYCGKEYHYQASGDGCLDATNDENYCPRCQDIINKALKREVPQDDMYIHCPVTVSEDWLKERFGDSIFEKMTKLKADYQEEIKGKFFSTQYGTNLEYDHIDIYNIGKCRFYVAWNDDEEENKHYFCEMLRRKGGDGAIIGIYNYFGRRKDTYSVGFMNLCLMMKKLFNKRNQQLKK